MIHLFITILTGEFFHYYDRPDRKLIKLDQGRYITPEGVIKRIDPYVAVFSDDRPRVPSSIFNEGELNGSESGYSEDKESSKSK